MPSSAIHSHSYLPDEQLLRITFTTGRRYLYFGVSAEAVRRFRAAMSKGAFFNTNIRDRYPYREIEPVE